LTRSPPQKICTIVGVDRTSTCWPISRHGTEYSTRPAVM
jgi:hypothetical protein